MIDKGSIRIVADTAEMVTAAETKVVRLAAEAIAARGKFALALAGGSTPKSLYIRLAARQGFPWDKTHFFWGDERHVPPDDPDSNYRMANEAMLSKVPVPAANIHRVKTENTDAKRAADEYAAELRTYFGGTLPRFDLVLL